VTDEPSATDAGDIESIEMDHNSDIIDGGVMVGCVFVCSVCIKQEAIAADTTKLLYELDRDAGKLLQESTFEVHESRDARVETHQTKTTKTTVVTTQQSVQQQQQPTVQQQQQQQLFKEGFVTAHQPQAPQMTKSSATAQDDAPRPRSPQMRPSSRSPKGQRRGDKVVKQVKVGHVICSCVFVCVHVAASLGVVKRPI
jgi:hypothetical protein